MRVSLNLIKKYVSLPEKLTSKQIADDLTLRTVEVESVIDMSEKYQNIVVGQIKEIRNHPNADKLKICITDIGEDKPVSIVCGGSNLYEGEFVVVSKPGAYVVWHGQGEPVKITETKMRGELSYGMICGASEVYLDDFFPPLDDHEIVDLKGINCYPGQSIAELIEMNDTVLEIDNKSLTNRPDLWGHYGIARELSCIYHVPLKAISKVKIDSKIVNYPVEIKEPTKCQRYVAIEIDNVYNKPSPIWMQAMLVKCGMRPINAIVDITNYVMITTGQPMHAFDSTHVDGGKIIVRNAEKDEKLLLLDNNYISLTPDDLVISDVNGALALAGIKGGKKDSILPQTTKIVLEIANFTAETIRKSGKRFDEKTDASIRYEKNIDTERVDLGIAVSLELFKELFLDCTIVAYGEAYPAATKCAEIAVSKKFLDIRLGKELDSTVIIDILEALGYKVTYQDEIYQVLAPVWRSTGDVSLKDDVLGDIARLVGYQNFEPKPLTMKVEHAICQNEVLLARRLREYLAFRCGFHEIYTYPWIDIKYIEAARIDITNSVSLATPPAPNLATLRSSLIPGMLEAISKNLRYFDKIKMFEMAQVFTKGEYHESVLEETLPIHKKFLSGCIVDKDAQNIFFELKGVLENMARYCHMENLSFTLGDRPLWADKNAYLAIMVDNEKVGEVGLVSLATMADSKIKYTNVAMFELNVDKLIPLASRTNEYKALPVIPDVEKDLSVVVDEDVTWAALSEAITSKVKEVIFVEEYRGNQIPNGKKSLTFRIKMGNDSETMTMDQINNKMNSVLKILSKKFGAVLREE